MTITSDNSLLLDEIFNDLKRKNIKLNKETKTVEGAMGDTTSLLELMANLTPTYIGVLISYLTYRLTQKKNYLHFKYKNGLEVKFDNLSKDELKQKEQQIREDIANDKLEFIFIG